MTRAQLINDIVRLDDDPPMQPEKSYRGWIETLSAEELDEYHGIVKRVHRRNQLRKKKS